MGQRSGAVAGEWSLRAVAVPAFGPSVLWSVGFGAGIPATALAARALGATVAVAALVVGVGAAVELVLALPVGVLVDRFGERRALVLGGVVDAVGSLVSWLAPSLGVLVVGQALLGVGGGIFLLARMAYLSAAAPADQRARALSLLGGATRVGAATGPLLATPVIAAWGPQAAFAVGVPTGLLAAALAATAPELPIPGPSVPEPSSLWQVVRAHRQTFATVGVGVLAIGLARSARVSLLPLWAESVGVTAATVAALFAVSGWIEVALVYPGGWLMDRRGRASTAVPTAVLVGLSLAALPLAHTAYAIGVLAVLAAVGNGLGSGIVMTLGADAAPANGRGRFLGAWRLLSLTGYNGAPVLVGVLASVAGLAAASVALGGLSVLGGAWLLRWLPRRPGPPRPAVRNERVDP